MGVTCIIRACVSHSCRHIILLILLHNVSFYPHFFDLQGLGYLHLQFQIASTSPDYKSKPLKSVVGTKLEWYLTSNL